MSCVWNVKESERHCDFCCVERCNDRKPKQPQTKSETQKGYKLQSKDHYATEIGIKGRVYTQYLA